MLLDISKKCFHHPNPYFPKYVLNAFLVCLSDKKEELFQIEKR